MLCYLCFTDLKYVDTRTFTRPKKRLFSSSDVNNALFERKSAGSKNELNEQQAASTTSTIASIPKIDLKIGGLVTSMQRSFLGDVSPPANMDSSFEPMGNSLITSSDFSNVNEFINGTEDSLSMAQFNQYRLSDAINDRNFLERLTNYDDSLFTKDADINNIDGNELIVNGNGTFSGNSTLQNSTDSSSNLSKNDDTFVTARNNTLNGTFDAAGEIDKTFIQTANSSNQSIKNQTFDANEMKPEKMNIWNLSTEMIDDENLSLCETFNVTASNGHKKPDEMEDSTLNETLKIEECLPNAEKIPLNG